MTSPMRNLLYVAFTVLAFVASIAVLGSTMPKDDIAGQLEWAKQGN